MAQIKRTALDLFFPRWCIGCGKEGDFLCSGCSKSLVRITQPVCPRCGRPQSSGVLCHDCVGWQAAIDGIRSPYQFKGVIREAVHQLKYRNLRALAPCLAELLCNYLNANTLPVDVVVPAPLHPKRLRQRGYNQAALLARGLGKLTSLHVVDDCLIRQKYIIAQTETQTVVDRRNNVANAFICRDDRLQGKAVLLIDDVATSGATLDACAVALKAAGAASVWGLTLAREI